MIGLALALAAIEDDGDVGVVELAGGRRFLAETLAPVTVGCQIRVEQLERDLALQLDVPRPIHRTEPAAADEPQVRIPLANGSGSCTATQGPDYRPTGLLLPHLTMALRFCAASDPDAVCA